MKKTVCGVCGDTPDPSNPGLGFDDFGTPGGLGGCGDLHQWVEEEDEEDNDDHHHDEDHDQDHDHNDDKNH